MTLFVLDERTVSLSGAAYRHPTDLTRSSASSQRKEGGKKSDPRILAEYITEK